jgi:single-strand DNA-binding protein
LRTYNRSTVLGRVGNDVVLRYTQSGQAVTNLSLATNERRVEGPEVTTWHRVVLWGKLAELAERYVRKGEAIYVEGPLQSRKWTNKEGETYSRIELTAKELIFLGKRSEDHIDTNFDKSNDRTEVELNLSPTSSQEQQSEDGEELDEIIQDLPLS